MLLAGNTAIYRCERETQEWEELMETKRTEAQATTL